MKHLRLAAWTVWFMLCWLALAHADPISGAISAIATILKAGGIGAALLKTAFGVAAMVGKSLLQRAMAKKQVEPGVTAQMQVGGATSFSFIIGTYATAGTLDYVNVYTYKTVNSHLAQSITLSDLPRQGISNKLFINGEICTVDFDNYLGGPGYPVLEYRRNGEDFLWFSYRDGSQTTASAFLTSAFGADPERPYTYDMIGRGTVDCLVVAKINRELFGGVPQVRPQLTGIPLYDFRYDSSVGGSGGQRWDNPATWGRTDNPVILIYNILRGIFYNGELVFGGDIPAACMPLATWIAAANECDIPIALSGGGTEPQFRAGYEVKVAEMSALDVIKELEKSCNGRVVEIGGIYKIHVGAPPLPVFFVTDEDFVVTDEQELDPFPGLESTVNGATATYPEPAAGWEMKDAPQRIFPELEAEDDGRRLLADFQFNAVFSPSQVQRLMKSMVLDGRRFRTHKGTLPPAASVLEPVIDTLSWTSVRNGYIDKVFLIDSMDDLPNVNQLTMLREVDPSDYDWVPGIDQLPSSVGNIEPRWPAPQIVSGWQVFPAELQGSNGVGRRPSIEVRVDGDLPDVRALHVKVRNKATGRIEFDAEIPYGDIEAP